jgi:PadR family transcriptional regulator PadR
MRRRGRGGRGRGRRAVRMLEPALLLLLHYGPAHGYTLMEQLREFGLGDLNPSVVYRALRDMEEREWVTSTWDEERAQGPPRRVYRLAALGDEVLSWYTQELHEARGMIDHLLGAYSRHIEKGEGEYH